MEDAWEMHGLLTRCRRATHRLPVGCPWVRVGRRRDTGGLSLEIGELPTQGFLVVYPGNDHGLLVRMG